MKTTDFAQYLSAYLTMYLPGQAGLSENTITSYRDTFKLVLLFAEEKRRLKPEKIRLEDFTAEFITDFLHWLEKERGCSIATRNQRLTALRAFAKYVRSKAPEYLLETQKISDLRAKKNPKPMVSHIPPDILQSIITKTDTTDRYGRRDMVLLCLMYDLAARVQEICDLRVRDVRLKKPFTVILSGKESKTRAAPIMESTAEILTKYIESHGQTATR